MELISTLCNHILKTFINGASTISVEVVPLTESSHCKNFLFMSRWNFSWCNFYLLSHVFSRWLLVKREPLPSLCMSFNTGRLLWGPDLYFCSPWRKGLTPSVFLHRGSSPVLWWSSWPFFGPSPVCTHLELWGSMFQGHSSFFFPFILLLK